MPRPLPTSCPTHLSEGELNGFILLPLQVVHEVHNGVVCSIHLLLASHQLLSLFSEVDILVQCLLVDVAELTQLLIAAVQLFPQLTEQELERDTSLTERHTTATLHTTCHTHLLHTTCHAHLLDLCLLVLGEGVRGEGAQLSDLLHALLLFLEEETAFGGIVLHGLAVLGYLVL